MASRVIKAVARSPERILDPVVHRVFPGSRTPLGMVRSMIRRQREQFRSSRAEGTIKRKITGYNEREFLHDVVPDLYRLFFMMHAAGDVEALRSICSPALLRAARTGMQRSLATHGGICSFDVLSLLDSCSMEQYRLVWQNPELSRTANETPDMAQVTVQVVAKVAPVFGVPPAKGGGGQPRGTKRGRGRRSEGLHATAVTREAAPSRWWPVEDERSGHIYYVNEETNAAQWERPVGLGDLHGPGLFDPVRSAVELEPYADEADGRAPHGQEAVLRAEDEADAALAAAADEDEGAEASDVLRLVHHVVLERPFGDKAATEAECVWRLAWI